MDAHKFLIGQHVYYRGTAAAPLGVYVVLARFPQHEDGEFEYSIRHSCGPQQLRAKEKELKVSARHKI